MRKHLLALGAILGLGAFLPQMAMAHDVTSASIVFDCNGYTLSVSGEEFGQPAEVDYTLTLTDLDGDGSTATISDSVAVMGDRDFGNFSASTTKSWGPFDTNFSVTGTATLVVNGTTENTIAVTTTQNNMAGGCSGSPPPPPPCASSFKNSSNFNGTAVAAGSSIWFNANFKASGIPSSGVTLDFTNGSITFTSGGTQYNLPVPNAKITFSPSASCTSTTYDSVTNTFMTTVPVTGDDEIFLTGLAWPVPSGGLPGGANPVNFNGSMSSEGSAPGVSVQMKWGAAAYSHFTTDYNALQIKAGHQTACGMNNGDHAGTPEGVDNNDVAWKRYVEGGARGGGGSNFTGSWSGTLSVPICPAPPPSH